MNLSPCLGEQFLRSCLAPYPKLDIVYYLRKARHRRYIICMTMDVKELENVVAHLPQRQMVAFRSWFLDFDADQWDKQIEHDAKTGALDHLAQRALRDLADGRCMDL